jgi:hypothetical protein
MKFRHASRLRTGRVIRRGLIALVSMAALTALLAGTASATSSGVARASSAASNDNAGDPSLGWPPCDTQSTSRHNTMTLVDHSNGDVMGTAYLVYSAGCQTKWVTVHIYPPYEGTPSVWLQNQSGSLSEPPTSGQGGTQWTYQLGSMKYRAACGGVQMYYGLTGAWVDWYYLGCY